MKRNIGDKLQGALLKSFKKNNFCDSKQTFRSNFAFEESSMEMTQRLIKETSCSSRNVCSLMPFGLAEYEDAFDSMRACLQDMTPSQGLKDMYFLTFVHIYLELVMSGRPEEALAFFNAHAHTSMITQEKLLVAPLKDIKSAELLQKSQSFSKIYNNYMEVKISRDEEKEIRTLLQSQTSLVLMKVFNSKIKVSNVEDGHLYFDASGKNTTKQLAKSKKDSATAPAGEKKHQPPVKEPVVLISPSSITTMPSTPTKNDALNSAPKITMESVLACCNRLRKSAPCAPNVYTLSYKNDTEGLTHGCLSNKNHMLCTAFESSTARLWNLNLDTSERTAGARAKFTGASRFQNSRHEAGSSTASRN